MATNEIYPFGTGCEVEDGDVMLLDDYAADVQRLNGHQLGFARRELMNTTLRQTSHMAAGLAQFIANRFDGGVVDDGDLTKIETGLVKAIADVVMPELILSHYESLTAIFATLAVLGNPDVTVVIDEACVLDADTTIPANMTLRFVGGGYFTGSGVQLFLNCDIIAGNQRIFDVGNLAVPGPDGNYSGVRVRGAIYETDLNNIPLSYPDADPPIPEGGKGTRANYTISAAGLVIDHLGVPRIKAFCTPKFSEPNLKWWGAIGDGVTDDHAACQAWADYVAESGLCGYAPSGTYHQANKDLYFWRAQNESYDLNPTSADTFDIDGRIHADGLFIRGDGCGAGVTNGRAGTQFRNTVIVIGDDIGNQDWSVSSPVPTFGAVTINYYAYTDRAVFKDFSVRQGTIRAHYLQSGYEFNNVHILVYLGCSTKISSNPDVYEPRMDVDNMTGEDRRVDRSAGIYLDRCLAGGFRNVSVGSYNEEWDADGTGVVIHGCNKFYWFGGRVGALPVGLRTFDPHYANKHSHDSIYDGFSLSTSVSLYNVYFEDNIRKLLHIARVTNCVVDCCTFHPGSDFEGPNIEATGIGRIIDVGQRYHASHETRNVTLRNSRFRHNSGTATAIRQDTVGVHCENAENVSIDAAHFRRPPGTLIKIEDSRDQYIANNNSNDLTCSTETVAGWSNDNWSRYAIGNITRDNADVSGLTVTEFDVPSAEDCVKGPLWLNDVGLLFDGDIRLGAYGDGDTPTAGGPYGIWFGSNGNANGQIYAFANVAAGSTGQRFGGQAGEMQVKGDGDVWNTNNGYLGSSDERLKEHIEDAKSQWEDIKSLRVVNFNFRKGDGHRQIGVIAQEVEQTSPGLVRTAEDGYKAVAYSVLNMKAVKALQEAMQRIEVLEATVKSQASIITDLIKRIEALEA